LFIEVFLARCNQIDSLPYHIDVAEKLFLECILLFADYIGGCLLNIII